MKVQSAEGGGTVGNRCYLGLGGNVGTAAEIVDRFRAALRRLEQEGGCRIAKVSSLYRTAAWGNTEQADFYNSVAEVETRLRAVELLKVCKTTEVALGRIARGRWGPREIDLDILLYGGETITHVGLTVPHTGLLERIFVYVPLMEIAPEVRLPAGDLVADRLCRGMVPEEKIQKLTVNVWPVGE